MQTNRTIRNSKPVIIIRDNEKGTCVLIGVAISGDRNAIKKEAMMVHFSSCNRITAHVECKNKSDTSNNGGKWNLLKII
jgi:hypothetical protein